MFFFCRVFVFRHTIDIIRHYIFHYAIFCFVVLIFTLAPPLLLIFQMLQMLLLPRHDYVCFSSPRFSCRADYHSLFFAIIFTLLDATPPLMRCRYRYAPCRLAAR